ncbi:response regulator [Spirochaeta africana]|uniref:Sensory/regulatory protein RpfC n=1 Tax=Spirochaeta africana (strain ATCC 700263 / DSM 8902 / Z-7692) TaxID=889378 RepID=H9UJU1_SPIAZ|nr:response regulator [Spirochaeta africana]AFG37784.1 PAS domain S-box [Spirochaeta africana DSM 8902]
MSSFGRQFQLIFEHLPHGMMILDTSGRIVYCNRSALTMLQRPQSEIMQSVFFEYLGQSTREHFCSRFTEVINGTATPHFQYEAEYRTGSSHGWWQIDISYIAAEDHSPFVFAVIDDITTKRHGEQRLIREREDALRATKTKSAFLANVSHEIRTPIHTIMGMSELLLDTSLDVEQREYAGQIQFSADVLLSLVNDVLDLSKIEAGKLSLEIIEFDLYTVLEDAADMISLEAHKKGLELIIDIDSRIPIVVSGDPLRLRQIVVNFLSNALKFTSSGMIVLRARPAGAGERRDVVRIEVEDTGIGIPEKQLPHLFQAFRQIDSSTTRKFGGTGLGLSISKSLVRMMKGRIGVRSRSGDGSVFWIEVPFAGVVAGDSPASVPFSELEGKRALVVDNDRTAGRAVVARLEEWGLDAQWVDDGHSAIQALQTAAGQKRPFDIALIDLLLAGMDGWQVAGDINADTRINATRLILMVPNGQLGADAKMKRLGWFDDYVTKPIRIRTLYSKLEAVLLQDLDLPALASEETAAELEAVDPSLPPRLQGVVLLAEDHEVNQELFRTILEHCGLQVVTASNGRDAVEMFRPRQFAMVFMDVQMPVMNGYNAARRIRAADPDVPIVGVTANALQGEREKCRQAGMNDYLPKPFKSRDVYPLLRRYMAEQAGQVGQVGEPGDAHDTPDSTDAFRYHDALETFLGKQDVLQRVLGSFLERGGRQLQEIEDAVRGGDYDTARILAHGIKGGAAHLEAAPLASAAGLVEQACMDEQRGAALQHLKLMQREFERFSREASAVPGSPGD